ncbi:hypothetical protein LP316_02640 [Thalassotalea sp. LPB0316]|uniref:flagellar basal body rod C-terminal domain-containing protein n=1 Tax=Thalassotalea sp. LPB0316 TaxID=2769490 RepID=UPI0018685ACC|nr:hypothetical protein [Thalassotalea sp. LPB0316]QOL26217.1 hypothetical protein LP316_02640 [Thalassotalea sp. LPB0316]
MEIQSAFNAGVAGYNNATEAATEAASNIARETARNDQAQQTLETEQTPAPQPTTTNEPVNLTEEVVNLRVAELQAQASAQAIQTADDTLGTLLDVRV